MIITITGPRSVGKSTISKLVAKKLGLPYVSSDEMGEKALEKQGGLDKAIKSGLIKEFIKEKGYSLILDQYNKNNFVFDVSGGSISSRSFPKASEELRKHAKSKSIIVGLLPYKDKEKSIKHLFDREEKREHFKNTDKKELMQKTIESYDKFPTLFDVFCDYVIYTENKTPEEVCDEIVGKVKK